MTDENGDTVTRIEYSTFGEAFKVQDGELVELENVDEIVYTFQGRRADTETGLMYFRNRYYSQDFGRFLQRDPLGYRDSYGLYEAFAGNPYGYGDPQGQGIISIETFFDPRSFDILNREIQWFLILDPRNQHGKERLD